MSYAIVQNDPLEIIRMYPERPECVVWPDGAASHAVYSGFVYSKWTLFEVIVTPDSPGEFYQVAHTSIHLAGGVFSIVRTWEPSDLDHAKRALRDRVDVHAEASRSAYLTAGTGQAMIYVQKRAEAIACLVDNKPSADKYPLLGASIGIDGPSLQDVATKVVEQSKKWAATGSAIERIRLGAKAAITAAKSVDEASRAAAVTWP